MPDVRSVSQGALVTRLATELKKKDKVKPPVWATYTKTGLSTERPPSQPDWWYSRAAALLRRIYLTGPVGTERMRTALGGRRRRGHKPAHHYKAGGKVIRLMLQQLEAEGLVVKTAKPRAGRMITPKGQRLVDRTAAKMA
jgi:small subunit ribosomal protein S19e